MNRSRVIILVVAAVAAVVAALVVRGLIGGGTSKSQAALPPAQMQTSEVLVASTNLDSGTPLTVDAVHWQSWPSKAVDQSYITQSALPDLGKFVDGAVVRSPLVAGQPITNMNVVHATDSGYMAAMLDPGMRAVSITVSTESVAGGFILPNDRVDVIVTQKISDSPARYTSKILLSSVRVLAVDQNVSQQKDQKAIESPRTATLELSPPQAQEVARAQAAGALSLALRPLGDTKAVEAANTRSEIGEVSVIRYGVTPGSTPGRGE